MFFIVSLILTWTLSPFFLSKVDLFLHRPGNFSYNVFSAFVLIAINLIFFSSLICLLRSNVNKWVINFVIIIVSLPYFVFNKVTNDTMSYFDFFSLFMSINSFGDAIAIYVKPVIYELYRYTPLLLFFYIPNYKFSFNVRLPFICIFLSVFAASGIVQYQQTGHGTKGLPAPIIIPAYFINYLTDVLLSNPSVTVRNIPSIDNKLKGNIVLIIDESVHGDFLSVNKDNENNPNVSILRNVVSYDLAVSYSNCSQYTNGLIRSMARFNNESGDIKNTSLLWEVSSKAGYKNILIDAQRNGRGHNFFTQKEFDIGNVNIINTKFRNDVEVAELVNDITFNSTGNFILIIKKGAHFPYIKQGAKEIYSPVMNSSSIEDSTEEQIINTYKNAIEYNTVNFFESLNVPDNTSIIYTSDHGQNFKNLSVKQTHCSTNKPDIGEGNVPMFIIFNQKHLSSPLSQKILTQSIGTHYYIPYILMNLFGYSDEQILSFMSNPKFNEAGFLYGNVYGFFGGNGKRYIYEK